MPMPYPTYDLTLHKSYYDKGFFNLGVEIDCLVPIEEGDVTLLLGLQKQKLRARVSRGANQNGTPRIHGGAALRDWFFTNFNVMDRVKVVLLNPREIHIISTK